MTDNYSFEVLLLYRYRITLSIKSELLCLPAHHSGKTTTAVAETTNLAMIQCTSAGLYICRLIDEGVTRGAHTTRLKVQRANMSMWMQIRIR